MCQVVVEDGIGGELAKGAFIIVKLGDQLFGFRCCQVKMFDGLLRVFSQTLVIKKFGKQAVAMRCFL